MKGPDLDRLRSEGELNISPRRQAWHQEQLDEDTKYWLEEDAKYFLHQSLSTPCLDVLARCKGAWLEDLQGNRFLDFHGNSVHQVGFGHPRVVQAIREQMETLPFCTRRYTNIPAIKLARKLTQLAPGSLGKVLFAPGGASAVGIALKLARMATGRFKTLSMWDSFHGASLDTISVGGEAIFRQDIGPLLPGTEHVPPPDAQHCPWDCRGNCSLKCAEYVDYCSVTQLRMIMLPSPTATRERICMRRAPPIELNAEELTALQRTVRSSRSSVREVFRARIVLLAADGVQSRDIAEQLGTGPDTVSKWRRRFAQQRLSGLVDQPGRGRKPHYGREIIERIVDDTVHRKPEQATHWSTRTMAQHAGVSHTTVQRIWHAHELKPHLVRTFKLSNDKHFVEKLRDVIGLYLNPPEHALVLCVDEKSQIQALDRSQPGLPMKKGRAGTMTHDYKRHGTTTLFAALNVLEGTVIGKCYSRHRHTEYLRFLREIDRRTPKELDIHLIVDNYSTHKHRHVKSWFDRHPRFHAHFIPTSSSWLNLVERFFREITERRIRRGIFRSVRELTQAIYDFLQHYNDNPRPFVWTKTADQILNKLAPLYANRG